MIMRSYCVNLVVLYLLWTVNCTTNTVRKKRQAYGLDRFVFEKRSFSIIRVGPSVRFVVSLSMLKALNIDLGILIPVTIRLFRKRA